MKVLKLNDKLNDTLNDKLNDTKHKINIKKCWILIVIIYKRIIIYSEKG